jgi:hypothetical protein
MQLINLGMKLLDFLLFGFTFCLHGFLLIYALAQLISEQLYQVLVLPKHLYGLLPLIQRLLQFTFLLFKCLFGQTRTLL